MKVKNISKSSVLLGAVRILRPENLWSNPKVPEMVEHSTILVNPGDVMEISSERLSKYADEDLKSLVPAGREPVSLPEYKRPAQMPKPPSEEEIQSQKDDEAVVKLLAETSKA